MSNTLEIGLFREQRAIGTQKNSDRIFSPYFSPFCAVFGTGAERHKSKWPHYASSPCTREESFFWTGVQEGRKALPALRCLLVRECIVNLSRPIPRFFSREISLPIFVPSSASCHGGREKEREERCATRKDRFSRS